MCTSNLCSNSRYSIEGVKQRRSFLLRAYALGQGSTLSPFLHRIEGGKLYIYTLPRMLGEVKSTQCHVVKVRLLCQTLLRESESDGIGSDVQTLHYGDPSARRRME